jgi:hypothetical protein
MAQSASLAEAKAHQARENLENYVFGTSVSTIPPVVPPMLPRGVASYPAYPYASAPTQWNSSTVPLAQGSTTLTSVVVLLHCENDKHKRSREFSAFL